MGGPGLAPPPLPLGFWEPPGAFSSPKEGGDPLRQETEPRGGQEAGNATSKLKEIILGGGYDIIITPNL